MSETKTITMEPNYHVIFDRLLPEITVYNKRLIREFKQVPTVVSVNKEDREFLNQHVGHMLQSLNGLLYAVSLCASSTTTQEQIDRYRDAVAEALAKVNEEFRNHQEEDDDTD